MHSSMKAKDLVSCAFQCDSAAVACKCLVWILSDDFPFRFCLRAICAIVIAWMWDEALYDDE